MRHLFCSALVVFSVAHAADESGKAGATPATTIRISEKILPLLDTYCFSCHDADVQKGNVRLDNLDSLALDARLDLLNHIQEQVFIGEMPPKKKKQPTDDERRRLLEWIAQTLQPHNASKLEDKLRKPEYGNVLDHDSLFSGKYRGLPGYTPDRRWLISEFIFNAKFNRIVGFTPTKMIDGKRHPVIGANNRAGVNLTNPFLLPTHSGVRYYDTTILSGGHLLTMLNNAREASAYLISQAKRNASYLATISKVLATEWGHERILASRENYLIGNIEPLLRELYNERHDALLPVFVATKREPVAEAAPDGKALKKPVYDTAKPSAEELSAIWGAMRRHSTNGESGEVLITKCERDWVLFGVSEPKIRLRVNFMHGYLDELLKRMPKANESRNTKPPTDAELAIIRSALKKHRAAGDTYSAIIAKCVASWSDEFKQERLRDPPLSDTLISELVEQLFTHIIERSPSTQEKADYTTLAKSYVEKLGREKAIEKLIQTFLLRSDFVYRYEFGVGSADEHGRKMLSPRDASYAIAYALTDSSPDKELQDAAKNGRLNTREDYRREVERLLKNRSQYYIIDEAVEKVGANDSFTNLPIRKLRFFREFFGYPAMLPIFKDNKRFGGDYVTVSGRIVSEADMLVEHILAQDTRVFERLLTTDEFFVFHSGDNQAMAASSAQVKKIYTYFKDKDWMNFDGAKLKEHLDFLKENEVRGVNVTAVAAGTGGKEVTQGFKTTMSTYAVLFGNGQTNAVPFSATAGHGKTEGQTRSGNQMRGPEVAKCFNLDLTNWDYPTTQPTKISQRKGLLTHPAWLIAFAGNTATDPIRRGKWVREKLLAGTVPETPVTVDAVVPEDHQQTLRHRLAKVTEVEYCWKCHERMNPLGYSFEMYDDFGRYRTEESLEHPSNLIKKMPDKGPPQADLRDIYKTLPINAKGRLDGTGDPQLDGEVTNAIDLAERLAKSTKVRQSIIRHAFRYFLGRNEVLSDSKTLIDADQAYLQSGGSFDAVIISLLTSDSFIYRKSLTNHQSESKLP